MTLYELEYPQRWLAGYSGNEPIYFDCADCGEQGAIIKGFAGRSPNFKDVILLNGKPALFCAKCFDKRRKQK